MCGGRSVSLLQCDMEVAGRIYQLSIDIVPCQYPTVSTT